MANEKRLIDAKALYTEVTEKYRDIVAGRYPFNIVAYDMAQLVKNAPTVDAVEVVHARWEDEYGGAFSNPRYRCSVCKQKALYRHEQNSLGGWEAVQALTDFCPNCGAKMGGDGNEC